MNILKIALSIGAGFLATVACYVGMSKGDKNSESKLNKSVNQLNDGDETSDVPINSDNSTETEGNPNNKDSLLVKLDKLQVSLINFARFISEIVRAISLFIRAMKYYEYEPGWNS